MNQETIGSMWTNTGQLRPLTDTYGPCGPPGEDRALYGEPRDVKAYYDQNTGVTCKDTMTVHEETREALVKYASPTGTFTVRVRQKPNPIGFHARLPGDRK